MYPSMMKALVAACDKGPGGVRTLPKRSLLKRRLVGSAFCNPILGALDSHSGGVSEFAREAGLLLTTDFTEPTRPKRPRPGVLAYSEVDRVSAHSHARKTELSLSHFNTTTEDSRVTAGVRLLGLERKEPITFKPELYCEALRSVHNLPGENRAASAPDLAFQRLAHRKGGERYTSREPLLIALLLEEYAISRLAPYAAVQNEVVLSHLPNVATHIKGARRAKRGVAHRPRKDIAKQVGARVEAPREQEWDRRVVASLKSGVKEIG